MCGGQLQDKRLQQINVADDSLKETLKVSKWDYMWNPKWCDFCKQYRDIPIYIPIECHEPT